MSGRKQPKIPSRKKRTNTANARPRLSRPLRLLSITETSAAEQSHSEEKDEDETIKVARIKKAPPPGEDELKEGLSVLSTRLIPVAPPRNETVLREMASEHPNFALPVPPSGALSNSNKLRRLWRFSPVLLIAIAIILVPFIGGGVLEAAQLNQARNSLYQVDTATGNTLWQQTITAPMQVPAVDMQGSLLTITAGQHMRQLV